MPDALKVATLSPTLKKSDADFEQFQNFRPISNLKVVSKLVEKAVAIQLTDHVMAHHLDETFQSAYKNFHSTETALVRVQNDILCAIDNNESVILLLLGLFWALFFISSIYHPLLISSSSTSYSIIYTLMIPTLIATSVTMTAKGMMMIKEKMANQFVANFSLDNSPKIGSPPSPMSSSFPSLS